jgi:hypothetical protein
MDALHPVEAKQFRVERSRFEQTVLLLQGGGALGAINQTRALGIMMFGAPHFFKPRLLSPVFWP